MLYLSFSIKDSIFAAVEFIRKKISPVLALLSGFVLLLVAIANSATGETLIIPQANANHNYEMPIRWHHAYSRLITYPDWKKLDRGEILCVLKESDGRVIHAQTMSMIKAKPEACYQIIQKYNQYQSLMPYTVESKIVRSFTVKGDEPGSKGVDFWTRINVWGFETRYLIRIIHLEEPDISTYRSYWTLVEKPFQVLECLDSEKKPCENDLSINIGSHQFEPYPKNPNWTLHTYTLKIGGKYWFQKVALNLGGTRSMEDVVQCLRRAVGK